MKTIIAQTEYICGHLRYGHFELDLSDEDYEKFKTLSKEEKDEWITGEGNLIIDDFELDDYGALKIINED